MKWLIFVCLVVCLARFCDGLAIKCPPGVTDPACTEDKIEDTSETSKPDVTDAQCLVGSEWESNCHYCRCSDGGVAECLKQSNCDKEVFAEPILCKPNTEFQRDCNTCICLENGLGLCTLEFCRRDSIGATPEILVASELQDKDEPDQKSVKTAVLVPNATLTRKERSVSTELAKTCTPGTEFRMDCNKCLCDNKGQDFSCTRIDCNALNNNHHASAFTARSKRDVSEQLSMKCVPGSVFDRDCNVCRCTENGQFATCSIKRCSDNKLETEHAPDSDLGFRCNPGEQFRRDCNDCTCSADGKSVFCTLRLCDEALAADI
ncbi:SCO-spondin isoform X3 [Helicoverpa armigera]|uniref:SCO-spondin isoform X3 n=1 Tax=Helicoverpa armigera TaxID=29058 RepID=UPI00308289AC